MGKLFRTRQPDGDDSFASSRERRIWIVAAALLWLVIALGAARQLWKLL